MCEEAEQQKQDEVEEQAKRGTAANPEIDAGGRLSRQHAG